MKSGRIGMIWAQNKDGVIGHAGRIPWEVPEDMARFRAITTGHTVIMGRKTWDSLPASYKPLPRRRNIVVTRQENWHADGAERALGVREALNLARSSSVWVIGGGEIYREALPFASVLEVTTVDFHEREPGDTSAPSLNEGEWRLEEGLWCESRNDAISYRFDRHERIVAPSGLDTSARP